MNLNQRKQIMKMLSSELTFSGIKVLDQYLHNSTYYCITCKYEKLSYTISISESGINLKYDLNNVRQTIDFNSFSLLIEHIKEVK